MPPKRPPKRPQRRPKRGPKEAPTGPKQPPGGFKSTSKEPRSAERRRRGFPPDFVTLLVSTAFGRSRLAGSRRPAEVQLFFVSQSMNRFFLHFRPSEVFPPFRPPGPFRAVRNESGKKSYSQGSHMGRLFAKAVVRRRTVNQYKYKYICTHIYICI